jgi:hypothetical protein
MNRPSDRDIYAGWEVLASALHKAALTLPADVLRFIAAQSDSSIGAALHGDLHEALADKGLDTD